ncbi:pseudouridine synthase [Flaviaesturariibacter amylovorans]|uniref:Pseudouridine synthase n=1 Tax=Flaviaesturariibacter amylovorans TaxID=1084520 RepID=A0ABP8G8A5_9BACT
MKKKSGFEKFHKSSEKKGAALKEQLRQEKKQQTRERKAFFEQQRKEKAEAWKAANETRVPGGKGDRMPPDGRSGEVKPKGIAPGKPLSNEAKEEQMPLNKFLAHGGVCSRREAADVVKGGKVTVNGTVVTEPGFKVQPGSDVRVDGKRITRSKNLVYILMNKPKGYLTTTDDPQERKTVLDLLHHATEERIYPVGRLDRNTSGVLLLTNDGELAQKLTHPSNEVKKVYAVTLDKPLTKNHFDDILKGVPLEDGPAHVDVLAFTDNADKTQIGVEIHSGRNRIVRRIFEHFGYDVKNLDRVMFAGLTKKNVPRGKWRFLAEKEVRDLKFFKKGKK